MRERAARRHAFKLEKIRHWTGDVPLPTTSWYRTPCHNAEVGGAGGSKHMEGHATDHPREWVGRHGGQERVKQLAIRAGCRGIGLYPSGAMHLDDRAGGVVTWSSFTPGRLLSGRTKLVREGLRVAAVVTLEGEPPEEG